MNQGIKIKPYKGYTGNVLLDFENRVYYGFIQDIDLEILYDGANIEDLQEDFENSVDEYLRIIGINERNYGKEIK